MAMTDTMTAPSSQPLAPSQGRPRRRWGVAFKALGRLFADGEDTGQVFEIMRALNGDAPQRIMTACSARPAAGGSPTSVSSLRRS